MSNENETNPTNAAGFPPQPSDTPAAEAANVTVVVKGKIGGTVTAAVGTTLRTALKDGKVENYETVLFQDAAGKPVSLDRKLTVNLELSSVAKVSGG